MNKQKFDKKKKEGHGFCQFIYLSIYLLLRMTG